MGRHQGRLPDAELWTAGFPCQDISFAGKGAGLAGERSGLFWTFMRAVRVVRPDNILLENVAALLHRGMGGVQGALAASGYDSEWDCISAAAVGAPHLRERVFVVAHAQRGRLQGGVFGRAKPPAIKFAENRCTSLGTAIGETWEVEPRESWLDDGLSTQMAEVYSRLLGNAVVPQVAEYVGRLLKEIE